LLQKNRPRLAVSGRIGYSHQSLLRHVPFIDIDTQVSYMYVRFLQITVHIGRTHRTNRIFVKHICSKKLNCLKLKYSPILYTVKQSYIRGNSK